MKNITRIIALLLALMSIVCSFAACGNNEDENNEPVPLTNEERFRKMLFETEGASKVELSADFVISVLAVYGSQREKVTYEMDMEMEIDGTDPENELTHTVSYLTVTNQLGAGSTVKSESYGKDGYMYTFSMGQRVKERIPESDEDEENPITLALKAIDSAVYTENEDGSLTVKVKIEASKNEDAKKAFIALFDMGMTDNQIRLCTIEDTELEFVIDKDNQLKSLKIPVSYSLIQTIPGSTSLYSTNVKYDFILTIDDINGNFTINFPTDLDLYKEQ